MGSLAFHNVEGGEPGFSLTDIMLRPGIFQGIAINVTWNKLEPVQGQLNTTFLDSCLLAIRNYNSANPQTPIAAKLRIWPGYCAPAWAKQLGGAPGTIQQQVGNTYINRTLGRFWTAPYRAAWKSFLDRLGTRYDAEPLIREICNVSGASVTDEPFIIPANAATIPVLQAAGYTDAQEKAVLSESINDYTAWPHTRLDWTFNPFRAIDSGTPVQDSSFAPQMERQWRSALGKRGILANHALSTSIVAQLVPIYSVFTALGAPLTFQTLSQDNVSDGITINVGIADGATQIELWVSTRDGGYAAFPENQLAGWSAALKANATKAGF